MKHSIAAAALLAATLTLPAHASSTQAGAYLGLKAGSILVDIDELKNDGTFGFTGGYQFNNGFAVEADAMFGGGDTILSGLDYDMTTYAIYGAYRSDFHNNWFLKGRLGLLNEKVKLSGYGGSESWSDTGLSVGFGGGYHFDNISIEAEYTIVEQDASYFTIGAYYRF
ncbi:porin family protein [Aliagarivorans marinus]|uniref:porin family protein n=1 Tax=Aliagarivorans marinus TaxID=561965 RepID=UPI000423E1C3|nr:porin family protein [Aliagarivorans marinus]